MLKKIKKGDQTAFNRLFDLKRENLQSLAYSYLHDEMLAEDVVQEVFNELIKKCNRFKNDKDLNDWLNTVAINKSLNIIKKQKREISTEDLPIRLGTSWKNGERRTVVMSVNEMMDRWMDTNVKGFVRESSLANYINHAKHISKYIGSLAACALDKQRVQQFVGELTAEECLSPGTVRGIITTLSSFYRCAVDYGFVTANPCARLRLPALNEKEAKVFTKREQERLEMSIVKGRDCREFGVLICLYTGIRLGELCALKWESVSLKERMLYVKSSVGRVRIFKEAGDRKTRIVESEPKTAKSRRGIPLPDFLCGLLKEMKGRSKSKYIVPSKTDPDSPLQPRTMQNVYKRLLMKAGLEYVNFHVLRHTFATRCIELGADAKSVSVILGHSNVNITMNRYTHSLREQQKKIMGRMNSFYANKKITRVNCDTGIISWNNINCVTDNIISA